MGRYKKEDLHNRYVIEQARSAYKSACISQSSYAAILAAYPDKLYTPNIFIRIALALLSTVAISFFSVLLFSILGISITVMLILDAVICYISLRLFIKSRKYFNAGIDNILIYYIIAFMVSAVFFNNDFDAGSELVFATAVVVSLILSIAFIDAFAALISCVCFIILAFLICVKFGTFGQTAAPFIIAGLCMVLYLFSTRYYSSKRLLYYRFTLKTVKGFSIVAFYASLNYFMVNKVSYSVYPYSFLPQHLVFTGWLFWITTIMIPVAYVVYGIRKKDLLFARIGTILIAAAICTVRYYHPILPAEVAMLLSGTVLMIVSYYLIRYLKDGKHGYICKPAEKHNKDLDLAALVMQHSIAGAHTGSTSSSVSDTMFDGGTGGGAGAGGNY